MLKPQYPSVAGLEVQRKELRSKEVIRVRLRSNRFTVYNKRHQRACFLSLSLYIQAEKRPTEVTVGRCPSASQEERPHEKQNMALDFWPLEL